MDEFLKLINSKYSENDLITKAYNFACKAHKNQRRVSGEPYIIHPIAVATILIDLGLDQETISAALLHDVVEDTPVSFKKIREEFGGQVEMLVKGVSKINSIKYSKSEGSSMRFQEQESPTNFEKEKVSWFTCSIILSISASSILVSVT